MKLLKKIKIGNIIKNVIQGGVPVVAPIVTSTKEDKLKSPKGKVEWTNGSMWVRILIGAIPTFLAWKGIDPDSANAFLDVLLQLIGQK